MDEAELTLELDAGFEPPPAEVAALLAKLEGDLFDRETRLVIGGRYRLGTRVAAGAAGVVYEAHDRELDRAVAVKLLRHRAEDADQNIARAYREAQALAKLAHPNVVAVYDVGRFDEDAGLGERGVYIVTELVAGQSMRRFIRGGGYAWSTALAHFVDAGRGLAAAHAHGLVHRDFKPANVQLGSDGRVRVLDFGLARFEGTPVSTGAGDSSVADLGASITATGSILGTPAYMAPEQHRGQDAEPRADQYAFCVALFEALRGRRPFEAPDLDGLLAQKLEGPPLGSLPRLPSRLTRALARGLSAAPSDRFNSMDELIGELGAVLSWRTRRWWALGGTVVAVGLVVSVSIAIARGPAAIPKSERCSHVGASMHSLWAAERRESVQAALRATGQPYAEFTARQVDSVLDARVADWNAARADACRLEAHEPGRARHAIGCLEQARREMAAVVELLEDADVDLVEHSVALVNSVPLGSHCLDAGAQSSPHLQGRNEGEDVEPLLAGLAHARAHNGAGRYADGLARLDELLDGDAAVPPFLRGQLELQRGNALLGLGDYEEAERTLEETALASAQAGDDAVALDAATSLAHLLTEYLSRPDEARVWARWAEAMVGRTKIDDARVSRLHRYQADIAVERNEPATALARYRIALESDRRREDVLAEGATLNSIGVLHQRMDRPEQALDAFTSALEIAQTRLGPGHPRTTMTRVNRANVFHQLGRLAQARSELETALDTARALDGKGHALVVAILVNLASVLLETEDLEDARRALDEAMAIAVEHLEGDGVRMGAVLNTYGDLEHAAGDVNAALGAHRLALAAYEGALGPEHQRVAGTLSRVAEIRRGQGDARAAISLYERAVRIRGALPPGHEDRVRDEARLAELRRETESRAAATLPR